MRNAKRLTWILLAAGALAACSTVQADSEGIAIRHDAENSLFVEGKAERHCAQFGKVPVKVQRSPADNTYFVRTVVTTYKCVLP